MSKASSWSILAVPLLRCWMGGLMNCLQGRDRNSGVNFCRAELGMAQHRLNEADVGAVLQHQRCDCVAEQVAGASFAKPGGTHVPSDQDGQAVGVERHA